MRWRERERVQKGHFIPFSMVMQPVMLGSRMVVLQEPELFLGKGERERGREERERKKREREREYS